MSDARTDPDVLVIGAGPAGAVAATVLARAGVRVLMLDRAAFPRPKLCGDTVNPGAIGVLRRLGLAHALDGGLPIEGMTVTGLPSTEVSAAYPRGARGVAISRAALDARLVHAAVAAGAILREEMLAQGPLVAPSGGRVVGVEVLDRSGRLVQLHAPVVIAADGRFSRISRALGLSRSSRRPRRWALGAYFEGVTGLGPRGEMHVRPGCYIGVAPLPDGLANVCLVTARPELVRGEAPLLRSVSSDPRLHERFSNARMMGPATMLGPLGVDAKAAGTEGLLLAGDAAGFVDPMTGDGLRFAFRGGELAAVQALRVLAEGWSDAHVRLRAARAREFDTKVRFNRALRALVGQPLGVRGGAAAAAVAPGLLRRVIAYAGDAA